MLTQVLAIGGEAAFGALMATVMHFIPADVRKGIVRKSSLSPS